MQKLIERLICARKEKNITLQDISQKTYIRVEILARIESGDTTFQPEPYIRAILKKYAEMVGVELHPSDFEEEPITEYQVSSASVAVPSTLSTLEVQQPERKKQLVYASLASALIVLMMLVWIFFKQIKNASQEQTRPVLEQQAPARQQATVKTIIEPNRLEESKPKEKPPETTEPQRALAIENKALSPKTEKKHTLVVRSKDDSCWISIASDKGSAKEMLLMPQAVAEFNADSLFTLTIGKLETAELWLNGKPVTLPRRSGAILGFKLMPPKD